MTIIQFTCSKWPKCMWTMKLFQTVHFLVLVTPESKSGSRVVELGHAQTANLHWIWKILKVKQGVVLDQLYILFMWNYSCVSTVHVELFKTYPGVAIVQAFHKFAFHLLQFRLFGLILLHQFSDKLFLNYFFVMLALKRRKMGTFLSKRR